MKNFKSKLAEKAGFTLVELIVVIAILGILAGVAVPSYTGYVAKAKDAALMSQLASVKTAADAAAIGQNTEVDTITVSDAGVITVDLADDSVVDAVYADMIILLGGTAGASGGVTVTDLTTALDDSSYKDTGIGWQASDSKWD